MSILLLPLPMMALFVHLFGGAMATGTEYVDHVVSRIILLCTGYGPRPRSCPSATT